jgi:hypothetical protein
LYSSSDSSKNPGSDFVLFREKYHAERTAALPNRKVGPVKTSRYASPLHVTFITPDNTIILYDA